MTKKALHRGLDLDSVDVTTPEEIKAFRSEVLEAYGGKFMYPLSAYSVMLETRPDMLKLHFRQMNNAFLVPGEGAYRILACATMLHWYTCHRYEEGILHEIRNLRLEGATKDQVGEILAIAFMHCGPSGLRFVYHAAFDYLRTYVGALRGGEIPRRLGPGCGCAEVGPGPFPLDDDGRR